MREIEEARAALDRVESNLERYRWIIQNPGLAHTLLGGALRGGTPSDKAALAFVKRLDQARSGDLSGAFAISTSAAAYARQRGA